MTRETIFYILVSFLALATAGVIVECIMFATRHRRPSEKNVPTIGKIVFTITGLLLWWLGSLLWYFNVEGGLIIFGSVFVAIFTVYGFLYRIF